MPENREDESIFRTLRSCNHRLITGTPETLRLRYILAEDGCKESQVALAKSLLKTPVSNAEERNFYSELAVYWLLKATRSGQEEAFTLLKDCVNSQVGISAVTYCEVEKCLLLSENEKISRRVAFSIFRAIMSDSEDIIPEEIFRERIDTIFHEQCPEPSPTAKTESDSSHKSEPVLKSGNMALPSETRVSFGKVVDSVKTCLEGNVPLLSLIQISYCKEFKNRLLTKYIYHFWDLLLKAVQNFVGYFGSLILPYSMLLASILLQFAGIFLPSGNELTTFMNKYFLSCIVIICFVAMLSFTCFIIHINFGNNNMQIWLKLIKVFEPNVKIASVEKKFLSKTSYILFAFLVISVIYIMLIPLSFCNGAFADIGIVSFLLMILVDRTIIHQRYNVNISLLFNAITCLSKVGLMQSYNYLNFLDWNISYEVGSNVLLSVSFLSCLVLPFVLPFLYVRMAVGNEYKGWHLVLLPHWMSLIWMNLACSHLMLPNSSFFIFLLASNYIGSVYAFISYLFYHVGFLHLEVILLMVGIFAISVGIVYKVGILNRCKLGPSILCLAVFSLSYHTLSIITLTSNTVLPWEKYQAHCVPSAWYRSHSAELQMACLPLKGRDVLMVGVVTNVHVVNVRNIMQTTSNVLPQFLKEYFIRAFGQCYANCDDGLQWEREQCHLYKALNTNLCHLHNWDEYNFQISLELSTRTSPEVTLITSHACSTLVRNLREGDILQVVGTLESNIGISSPRFQLKQAQCTNCYSDTRCNTSVLQSRKDFGPSLKNVVWFFFYPLLQYQSK